MYVFGDVVDRLGSDMMVIAHYLMSKWLYIRELVKQLPPEVGIEWALVLTIKVQSPAYMLETRW